MRTLILPVALGFGLLLGGCEDTGVPDERDPIGAAPTTTAPQVPGTPATGQADIPEKAEKAVAIAQQVRQNPQQLDAALQQVGMSRDDFDELMYDVAQDPKLTDAYLAQREAPAGTRRE